MHGKTLLSVRYQAGAPRRNPLKYGRALPVCILNVITHRLSSSCLCSENIFKLVNFYVLGKDVSGKIYLAVHLCRAFRKESDTNCLCFALRSFLIGLPFTFQNFFTFTLFPGSSALLQTPECSEYHPSEQSPVVSALSLTRLQYLEPTPCFCPPFYLCQLF